MYEKLIEQGWSTKPAVGFNDIVGPIWARRDGEAWLNGFVAESRHLNFHRQVHGGMMATFADSVLGRVVFNAIKPRSCVTVQLNMHYLAPVQLDDFVIGRGEIIRVTRSMVFVAGRFSVGPDAVASAVGVWKIIGDSGKRSERAGDADSGA